jgi:ATP-dependent RNA helicase UAP56/SUB2
MSSNDNEDLIDYEDEHDVVPNGSSAAATNGATAGDDEKDKKNFSGIHSTGFRCVLSFVPWSETNLYFLGISC